MNQINPAYLIKLIEASEALSADKKAELKAKLNDLPESRLSLIKTALEQEQTFNADYYRKIGQIKTHAAEQKIKQVYHYAEAKLTQAEAEDLAVLEDQIADLEN